MAYEKPCMSPDERERERERETLGMILPNAQT